MEERQLRLGDTLDDYCPRERRVTNHAVVAMVGADVKQTRCTTCESEHEYKHAKVPRQRKKSDSPAALYAQVASSAPKRAVPPQNTRRPADDEGAPEEPVALAAEERAPSAAEVLSFLGAPSPSVVEEAPLDASALDAPPDEDEEAEEDSRGNRAEEGPVHRQLIRASLPREGQPALSRPIPEFTIRQPTGRPGRFRPRPPQPGGGGQQFQGHRANGNGPQGNHRGGPRPQGSRPPQGQDNGQSRQGRRNGQGHKRSK